MTLWLAKKIIVLSSQYSFFGHTAHRSREKKRTKPWSCTLMSILEGQDTRRLQRDMAGLHTTLSKEPKRRSSTQRTFLMVMPEWRCPCPPWLATPPQGCWSFFTNRTALWSKACPMARSCPLSCGPRLRWWSGRLNFLISLFILLPSNMFCFFSSRNVTLSSLFLYLTESATRIVCELHMPSCTVYGTCFD